ncbi:unnamed protein product [Pieris brassicae]|uniref:Uncharacterized protein n=1 Tax=Pieris brassicae TaxID=7116 RepID=A0A9P0SZ05_PIEBR|nr:unnamed protein product [Pieris brassicae]
MSANTLFGILVITLFSTLNSELISDSGWQPISSEKVYSSRNFIKTQVNRNSEEARNVEEFTDSTFGANIKLTDAREIFSQDFHPKDSHFHTEDEQSFHNLKNEHDEPSTVKPSNRMAKKITKSAINEIVDSNEKNTYEITEDVAGEQSNIILEQYQPTEQNPTNDFLKILSNYNIRTSDKLPNYSLSLRQNSRQSPGKDFIYINVPVRIPLRYNSPDHLPVDPLIAVLLSNYGHYLPGYYGVHGNYQNLYGYSASNNIHNNKPFGSYKIYSDVI